MPTTDAMADADYGALRTQALHVLLAGVSPEDRRVIEDFLARVEARTLTIAEADKTLKAIVARANEIAPLLPKRSLLDLLQTPPFYFFFGFALLGTAFVTSGFGLNTSLTFLVAMLGVAIMLYGTGSQAAGAFGANPELAAQLLREQRAAAGGAAAAAAAPANPAANPAAAPAAAPEGDGTAPPPRSMSPAAANLVIAGGAAVLTAFFGWGVITYQNEIRQVFRDYDQYTKVRFEFCDVAVTKCADPDVLDNVDPEPGRQIVTEDTMRQIRETAYLETGLGERAYGKADDNGLEFIIFERDLGQSGTIKLVGASALQGPSLYAAEVNYFSLRSRAEEEAANTNCLVPLSQSSCAYVITVRDGLDLNRVPRVVIRAVLSPQSVATNDDEPVVPQ